MASLSRRGGRPSRSRSAGLFNKSLPGLEPLEVRALLSGQPTSLSDVSASGIRTETATLSADLTSGGSASGGPDRRVHAQRGRERDGGRHGRDRCRRRRDALGRESGRFQRRNVAGFVEASYAGDPTYGASSGSGTLTVTPQAVAQVALASSANPSLPGELMTFGVLAIPLSGGPRRRDDRVPGRRRRLRATVTLADGSATSGLVTSLAVGTHTITAIYSGDATYPGQTVTTTQTVESPSEVTGHVYTVTSLGDTGTGSGTSGDLRYAITQADANPGSVIDFSVTGTIQLTKALPGISANTTINGPGPSLLFLKGGGASSQFTVLGLNSGMTATISGLTITGGDSSWDGGGVYDSGNLTLVDCVVTGNTADAFGGGVEMYNGQQPCALTLIDSTVSDNSIYGSGGGVSECLGCNLTVTNSIISGNSSVGGPGGIGAGGSASITDSNISQNTTNGDGGGIGAGDPYDHDTLTMIDCSLSGNTGGGGGAIYGAPTLTDCTLSGNTATDNGGALETGGDGLTLTNCTFLDNSSPSGGTISFHGSNTLTLAGCTWRGT